MGITIKSLAEIEEEVSGGRHARLTLGAAGPECKANGSGEVVMKYLRRHGPSGPSKPGLEGRSLAGKACLRGLSL